MASRSRTRRGKNCARSPPNTGSPANLDWREEESSMTRQMALVGFLQAQNCTNLPSSWRHPESRDDSMSSDYYQEIGRILEAGKFHMAFFDDRLAMPDRYGNDHADEFMEVVLGHWDAWEDGAVVMDKKSGRFADPAKVKRLDHKGQFFKSRGPFTVPRSSQGHPVVIQAGASGRGQRFAGRWGEVIFTAARNLASAKQGYDAIKNEAAKAGRDPDQMFLCNLITPVPGATKAEAEDKMALINKLPLEINALSLLAEGLNFDFAAKGIDEPLTTEELQGMQGMLGIRDGVLRTSGKTNPSTRDFITFSGRGQTQDAIVGGPKEIADRLEEMFAGRGCDGFVIAATYVPGSYADFVKHIVPELQRRGLFHKDYSGKTLRENLGLRRPAAGAWKLRPQAAAE